MGETGEQFAIGKTAAGNITRLHVLNRFIAMTTACGRDIRVWAGVSWTRENLTAIRCKNPGCKEGS